MNVKDKVVVVTGAAGGIGQELALSFARKGAKVVATDLNGQALKETESLVVKNGGEILTIVHDVTQEDVWIEVFAKAERKFGGIDVLVNNAGIYIISLVTEISLETWNKLMAINVTAVFLGAKHVIPYLSKRGGGSIINLSSIAGLAGAPGHALYGASKGAVRIMTKDLAAELAPKNIRVNSVHPGYVKTAMASYASKSSGTSADVLERTVPLGRLAEPADVANMILFLAAEESSYLSGCEYIVDGAQTQTMVSII